MRALFDSLALAATGKIQSNCQLPSIACLFAGSSTRIRAESVHAKVNAKHSAFCSIEALPTFVCLDFLFVAQFSVFSSKPDLLRDCPSKWENPDAWLS